ncbi:MAG TPA: hypothetical protein VJV96_11430 [Candidatus Angelobacter sp.]|nr:hypothetical protein [Candidatus Angelobacter sp.]
MKKLCRITEEEVISEFLKAEFYQVEYDRDRTQFESVVYEPDLSDPDENALRKALLFRRRGPMWRELPPDTQWWEVEFKPEESERVNVFPRAQWRALARGNFNAIHVAERLRALCSGPNPSPFVLKVQALCSLMQNEGPRSTLLLIGVDETHRLTLLEGNHRFVASLLLPRDAMLRRIRLVCGFSPVMERCCWYKTSFSSLARYLKNRIKYVQNREADVSRWLAMPARPGKVTAALSSAATTSIKPE